VRGSSQTILLYEAEGVIGRILVDADLGRLLGRCDRVVLRQGAEPVALEAATVIHWRALQVVTSSPHLPSPERLNQILPGAHIEGAGFHVALGNQPPEQVLAECLTHGIRVMESRVIYCPPVGTDPPESLPFHPVSSPPA
jgi:hypothetical protein